MKHDEIVFQIPVQTTNISILQSASSDQMVNYAPIVHTFPAHTDGYICDVESTPLILFTPITPLNGTQMTVTTTANECHASDSNVDILPLGGNVLYEVSANSACFVFNFMVNVLFAELTCRANAKLLQRRLTFCSEIY